MTGSASKGTAGKGATPARTATRPAAKASTDGLTAVKLSEKPAAPTKAAPAKPAAGKAAAAKSSVATKPQAETKPATPPMPKPEAARASGLAAPPQAPAPEPPPAPELPQAEAPIPAASPQAAVRPPLANGRPTPPPRPLAKAENFAEGDHVVYPTHGVGKVERIAVEEIAGHRLELIHITFEENRMTLRVPVAKARTAGLRKLASRELFEEAMAVLKGRARIKRTMWSRRAQEYEAKINSGDPLAIAEVVRDLHRNAGQPDQSFSERQIYEAAMDRLAAELAALDQTDKPTATTKLVEFLKTV
jgi:CarD family transcriptional regulator